MENESVMSTVEDTVVDFIPIGTTSAKEGIKAPFFHLAEDTRIKVVEEGRLNILLVLNVNIFGESDQFIDALAQPMLGSSALIKLMVQLVKNEMDKINYKCLLGRIL